jgi:ribosome-binding protein aMBF1 (putative translation factor)
MNSKKRKALEAAGWKIGDAADFLGMSDQERQLLNARVEVAFAVRRQRESHKLSQQQLASRIKTSQPRIVKIERAAADVSLDQLLRAFAAAGGRIAVHGTKAAARSPRQRSSGSKSEATVIELTVATR